MALVNLRNSFNKAFFNTNNKFSLYLIAKYSDNIALQYESNPGPHFINPDVQKLLKSMTRIQFNKVFRKRAVLDNSIEYKFMTTEQLEHVFQKAIKNAEARLQMPPVVKIKNDVQKIISDDAALKEFSDIKYVVTDITFGLKQSKRKVLVRQMDGILEYASEEVRKRMNQIYFPLHGRQIRTPHMFEPEHLKRCLNNYQYEFILDRLCIQYEPYEKDYSEISSKVYMHINENKRFDDLRSTRHFGPMAFFLAWHRLVDDILSDMIKRDYLRNGVEIIAVMYILNNIDYDKSIHEKLKKIPQENLLNEMKKSLIKKSNDIHEEIKVVIGKVDHDFQADDICLKFIEDFVKTKSLKKVQLELSIQSYKEMNDEKRKLYDGLRKAHGLV